MHGIILLGDRRSLATADMAGSSALYSLGTRGPDNLYPRRDNRVRREAMLGAAAASTASLVSNPFDTVRGPVRGPPSPP